MSAFVTDSEVAPGGAFVPLEGPANRGGLPPTKVDACPPYYVVFDPQRWTIIAGRVVPQFSRLPLLGGLNGVDETRNRTTGAVERLNAGMARAQVQDRGRKLIPFDAVPTHHIRPGQPRSYLWKPEGRPDVHLMIYTKVFPGSADMAQDTGRYLEWIDYLYDEGHIERPPAYLLRRMLDARRAKHLEASDKARTMPSMEHEVKRLAAEIEAIETELATHAAHVPTDDAAPVSAGETFVMDEEPTAMPTPRPPVGKGRK